MNSCWIGFFFKAEMTVCFDHYVSRFHFLFVLPLPVYILHLHLIKDLRILIKIVTALFICFYPTHADILSTVYIMTIISLWTKKCQIGLSKR